MGWLIQLALAILGFFLKPMESQESVQAAKAGAAQANEGAAVAAAKTSAAIAEAEANAPETKEAVINSLDKGTF